MSEVRKVTDEVRTTYNAHGLVESISRASGSLVEYTYDREGREISVKHSNSIAGSEAYRLSLVSIWGKDGEMKSAARLLSARGMYLQFPELVTGKELPAPWKSILSDIEKES